MLENIRAWQKILMKRSKISGNDRKYNVILNKPRAVDNVEHRDHWCQQFAIMRHLTKPTNSQTQNKCFAENIRIRLKSIWRHKQIRRLVGVWEGPLDLDLIWIWAFRFGFRLDFVFDVWFGFRFLFARPAFSWFLTFFSGLWLVSHV